MLPYATQVKLEGFFICSDNQDDKEVFPLIVHYNTLSKKDLVNSNKYRDSENQLMLYFLEKAVTKIENVPTGEGLLTTTNIEDIPQIYHQNIVLKILKESQVPNTFHEQLSIGLDVSLDKQLKSDTWKCDTCQARGLDKVRNCGFLGADDKEKNEYYSSNFAIEVNGVVYTQCPIYNVDNELLNEAFTSYEFYKNGLLPEAGGMYDQPEFFVASTSIVSSKVAQAERREIEKNRNSVKGKK